MGPTVDGVGSYTSALTSLRHAINLTGTAGLHYPAGHTTAHPTVTAARTSKGSWLRVVAKTAGASVSIPVSDTAGFAEWFPTFDDTTTSTSQLTGGDDGGNAWYITGEPEEQHGYAYTRLQVDENNDFYWPRYGSDATTGEPLNRLERISGEDGSTDWQYELAALVNLYSVSLEPRKHDYETALGVAVTGPEHIYVTTDQSPDSIEGTATVYKLKLITASRNTDATSPRAFKYVTVAGGSVRTFTDETVSGNIGTLDTSTSFIQSVSHEGKLYLLDGLSYKVYDPRAGTFRDWLSTTAGEMPKRAKLLTKWNGRGFMARSTESETGWYASAQGDLTNWDYAPPVPSPIQAVASLANDRIGANPDIITALIPWTEDILIFGGDNSVHALVGDPMLDGRIDNVSTTIGVAFGSAWTKDPEGNLYFFGNQGGIFAMAKGSLGAPVRISLHSIEDRLRSVDLSTYRIEMAWNWKDEGLHIFQVPTDEQASSTVKSWFWCKKNASWWEDEFGALGVEPSAVAVIDGDEPGDRVLLLGGHDGYIRKWDQDAVSDDGNRIVSEVLLGPLAPSRIPGEVRYTGLHLVLASAQDGAQYELYGSSRPDVLGEPRASGPVPPGRSGRLGGRVRGSVVAVKLRNAAVSERWAYESGAIGAYAAGRKRVRK
jgi:hypothetical protein